MKTFFRAPRAVSLLVLVLFGATVVWAIRSSDLFASSSIPTYTINDVTDGALTITPDQTSVALNTDDPHIGQSAPDFTLKGLDGKTYHLHDMRGQVVYLNFWSTTCVWCREEMPTIEAMWQGKGVKSFVVWGIDVGESAARAAPFVRDTGVSYPILLDSDSHVGGDIYPATIAQPFQVFIDRQGIIRVWHYGALTRGSLETDLSLAGLS